MNPNPTAERPSFAPGYGIPSEPAGLLAWDLAQDALSESRTYWLATVRPDGRPHVAPVWAIWLDGAVYFSSDEQARKARNLAQNPEATMHVEFDVDVEKGKGVLILEGHVEAVRGLAERMRAFEAYRDKYGMSPEGPAGSISPLYAFHLRTAFAWRDEPFQKSVTRWRFPR